MSTSTSITNEGRELQERIQENMEAMGERLKEADRTIQRVTKERPMVAAFTALTAGYFIGRVLSHR